MTDDAKLIKELESFGAKLKEAVGIIESTDYDAIIKGIEDLSYKAALWDGLMSVDRIRILGTGSLGELGQHFGMEIWETHSAKDSEYGIEVFTKFAERMIIKNAMEDVVKEVTANADKSNLLAPITPGVFVNKWKCHPTDENLILGTWAEDGTTYSVKVPAQLRESIIYMQNQLADEPS